MKTITCLVFVLFAVQSLAAQRPTELTNLNKTPKIFLTDPVDGAEYSGLSPINLAAIAYASGNELERVEFWVDGKKIGNDYALPYGLYWFPPGFGSFEIMAIAVDTNGNRTNTRVHTITFTDFKQHHSIKNDSLPANDISWEGVDDDRLAIYDHPVQIDMDLKVSPNPVKGGMARIELFTPIQEEMARITIINNNGQRVKFRQIFLVDTKSTTFDLSKCMPGAYFAVVELRDDVVSKKFVIVKD